MQVIEYNTLQELREAANKLKYDLLPTNTFYSFRIFDVKGQTKELHIFKIK